MEDYVERSQRPTMTNEQALVKILDARGILYELKVAFKLPKSLRMQFLVRINVAINSASK